MIMWTHTSGETSADRPKRVRLPDFTTRTSDAVTDDILAEAGWTWVEPVVEMVVQPTLDATSGFYSSGSYDASGL
jgi:hypothetical protein